MVPSRRRSRPAAVAALLLGCMSLASPAITGAQSREQQARVPSPTSPPDFLLGRPKGSIAVRGGWLFANTSSDIYSFVTDELTLDKKAFNTAALGGEIAVALTNRFDVVVGLERARSRTGSEYRDFVDNQLLPIAQTTERQEYSLSASLRYALLPRGERISRFAWIPRRLTPYVGAGGGALRYRFTQYGSFIDADSGRVFDESFRGQGWTPSVHVLGGTDVRLYRRIYLSTEARYTWSSGALGADFVDFEPVTLAGLRLGAGLQIIF